MSVAQVLEAALALSSKEKAALIDALLSSLDRPNMAADQAWIHESEERLKRFDSGDMEAFDADDVLREFDTP